MPECYYRKDEVFLTEEEVQDSAYLPEERIKVIARYLRRCDEYCSDFQIKTPRAVLSIAAFNLIRTIDSLPYEIPVADAISEVITKICVKLNEIKRLYDEKQIDKALEAQEALRRALSTITF